MSVSGTGEQTVEEMMDRLKARFKAAGLDTNRSESFSENMVQDEHRCITQLRTYVKLCKTMGAMFVINEKARGEIFDAIKLHANSINVIIQALLCLGLLLQDSKKDARKSKQTSFEVYNGSFDNVINLPEEHLNSPEYSLAFVQYLQSLLQAENTGREITQKADKANVLVQSIIERHSGNNEILNCIEDIQNMLNKYKNQASNPMDDLDAYGRTNTVDELADWADGDLVGNFDGPLVSDNVMDRMRSTNQRSNSNLMRNSDVSQVDNSAELDEAKRLIAQYQMDIQALGNQLSQIQLEYQADKEIHGSLMKRLTQVEQAKRRIQIETQQKIVALENNNKELKEELGTVKSEKYGYNELVQQKEAEFEQMKVMISNQMDQARAHYLALKAEYETKSNLTDMLKQQLQDSQSRIHTLEEQLHTAKTDAENHRMEASTWRSKCEDAERNLVVTRTDNADNLQKTHTEVQKLQEENMNLKNEYQRLWNLDQTLKNNFVSLKMELQKIKQENLTNPEVLSLRRRVTGLEKEKNELIEMSDQILNELTSKEAELSKYR